MNSKKTSRNSQTGHFVVAFGMALALNAVMALALLHTPTEGQRYLAAVASVNAPAVDVAEANCIKGRV